MAYIPSIEALGDPTRRKLFERLREGPCSVTDLVNTVPVSQPAVSQHLRVLREARLVQVNKRGNQRIYSMDPEGVDELRHYVEDLWENVLESFQRAAENFENKETSNE